MGILEEGFERLHWPPLVKEIIMTTEYPGYRYEFFKSFTELDSYFKETIGLHWRKEPWAEYWMNQHLESKREDRKDADPRQRKPFGPRRDSALIFQLSSAYLKENPKTSSYKLASYLRTLDITITQKTAWSMIKKYTTKLNDQDV